MAFQKRKNDRRKPEVTYLSGVAEVCETRALLSAEAICLPAVEATDVVEIDDEVVVDDAEVSGEEVVDGEFVPGLAVCTMFLGLPEFEVSDIEVLPPEQIGEEEIVSVDGEVDPSLMFSSFMTFVGEEGEVVEEFVGEQEVVACEEYPLFKGEFEDVVDGEEVVEEFDPTWLYRCFTPVDFEFQDGEEFVTTVEEEVLVDPIFEEFVGEGEEFVDPTTLEDFDPSWLYRSVIVDGEGSSEEAVDVEPEVVVCDFGGEVEGGNEEAESEELYLNPMDSIVECGVDPEFMDGEVKEGEVVVDENGEVLILEKDGVVEDGEVVYVRDYVRRDGGEKTDGGGEEPIGIWYEEIVGEDGTIETIVRYYGDNFRIFGGVDTPEILMSATGGPFVEVDGSAEQPAEPMGPFGPVVSPAIEAPVVAQPAASPVPAPVAVTPTIAIPVYNSFSRELFEEEELVEVVVVSQVLADDELASDISEDSVSSSLDSAIGDLVLDLSESESSESSELTPVLGSEEESTPADAPAAEEVPVETEEPVSVSETANPAVTVARTGNDGYAGSVDRYMTEFAMNGFVG